MPTRIKAISSYHNEELIFGILGSEKQAEFAKLDFSNYFLGTLGVL